MTLPYIWPNVQPSEWVLHNLNIDISKTEWTLGRTRWIWGGAMWKVKTWKIEGGGGQLHWGAIWKVKNWKMEDRGGPWSIEGGDLGSGGLSGGCDGFTTPFTATNPTQPWVFSRKCSMASHWIWGLFIVTYCDLCRISGTSLDPISHKCTPTSSSAPLSLSCSRAAPCGAPFLHPAPLCVSSRLSIRSDHNVCAILAISWKSRSFLVSWMISHTEKLIWASFYSLVPDIWPWQGLGPTLQIRICHLCIRSFSFRPAPRS